MNNLVVDAAGTLLKVTVGDGSFHSTRACFVYIKPKSFSQSTFILQQDCLSL